MVLFKDEFTFEKRKEEANRILEKYPDRIPIICERNKNSTIEKVDKKKFLVPKDLTVGQFMYVLRKRIKLKPEQAIFLFVNNTLPPVSSTIGNIYSKHKDSDNFIYFIYSGENVFGS